MIRNMRLLAMPLFALCLLHSIAWAKPLKERDIVTNKSGRIGRVVTVLSGNEVEVRWKGDRPRVVRTEKVSKLSGTVPSLEVDGHTYSAGKRVIFDGEIGEIVQVFENGKVDVALGSMDRVTVAAKKLPVEVSRIENRYGTLKKGKRVIHKQAKGLKIKGVFSNGQVELPQEYPSDPLLIKKGKVAPEVASYESANGTFKKGGKVKTKGGQKGTIERVYANGYFEVSLPMVRPSGRLAPTRAKRWYQADDKKLNSKSITSRKQDCLVSFGGLKG